MRLEDWDVTIQKITDECNHKRRGTDKVLKAWRLELEKEPTSQKPFQIDGIVREVRRRLSGVSQ